MEVKFSALFPCQDKFAGTEFCCMSKKSASMTSFNYFDFPLGSDLGTRASQHSGMVLSIFALPFCKLQLEQPEQYSNFEFLLYNIKHMLSSINCVNPSRPMHFWKLYWNSFWNSFSHCFVVPQKVLWTPL